MPKEFYEEMWRTIKTEKKAFVGDIRNMRKDGTEYWQELHVYPILDAQGVSRFFIGIEPVITDKKKREQFRNEFVSIISHQLKNPLTAIRWILEWLAKDSKLTPEQRASIENIYRFDLNLINLINDLLTISRVGKIESHTGVVDITKEITTIVEDVQRLHPAVVLSFICDIHSLPLDINKTAAIQVFSNIISNAAEYADKKEGKVDITLTKKGPHYVFMCRDNGIGIPPADQQNIFSKAFRASNAKQAKEGGTGLGLFIVKIFADDLGWNVSFESEVGKGTSFKVTIPVSRG